MDQNLINYIKQNKAEGFSDDQIKKALLEAGWEQEDINQGFKSISEPIAPEPAPAQSIPSINKLPSPIALLKDAWGIYKSRFWVFIGIMLVAILFLILTEIAVPSGISLSINLLFSKSILLAVIISLLLWLAGIVIQIAIQVWSQASLVFAVKDSKERISIIEAYKRGGPKIISYYWISVLKFLILIATLIFLIIPAIILWWQLDLFELGVSLSTAILGIIITLILLIPAVIFLIWLSLANYILIAENTKGTQALLKSKEYMKGRWWAVFWRFLVMALFYLIIIFVIGLLVFLIFVLAIETDISWLTWLGSPLLLAMPLIFPLFLTPLTITYSFLIYKNLKVLKREFEFKPNKKTKTIFIMLAIIGLLLLLAVPTFVLETVIKNIINPYEEYEFTPPTNEYQYEEKEFPLEFPDTEEIPEQTPEQTTPPIQQPPSETSKVRDDQRWTDLGVLSTVLEIYHEENGHYPKVTGCTDIYFSGLADTLTTIQSMSVTKEELPKDPSNIGEYIYLYSSDGTTYVLRALFEDPTNQWLNYDYDGNIMACPCDDPAFCIKNE